MTSCIFLNLTGFGFGNVAAVNTGQPFARMMDAQHYLHRIFFFLSKKSFKDLNNKFHCCIIVVEQQYRKFWRVA